MKHTHIQSFLVAITMLATTHNAAAVWFPSEEDYEVSQDGPWTVVPSIYQKVERTNTAWSATPGAWCSHYSFALRKLVNQGGDTHLLGRFDPDNGVVTAAMRFPYKL